MPEDIPKASAAMNVSQELEEWLPNTNSGATTRMTGNSGFEVEVLWSVLHSLPIWKKVAEEAIKGFSSAQQSQGQKFWDDIILSGGIGDCSNLSTRVSECISALDSDSLTACEKGFFSDCGLEQLFDAVVGNAKSISNPNSSDKSSTSTVTRAGSSYVHSDKVPFVGLSSLNGGMDGFQPKVHSAYGPKKEVLPKSLVSSWIDSSTNISAESAVISQPKKPGDPAKITRKRTRPGESTRPRPKDRQQIQDRVKDLLEIVPNVAKCSIDELLDRTIKHMLFLQSVTNGGQTMVCPIIVEDLHPPGQMLVEMLCEERGFFLEIADIIRGFGLTILKGVMEVRDDKVWSRFVVEANRDITRMDIFMSLVRLLPQTMEASIGSSSQTIKSFRLTTVLSVADLVGTSIHSESVAGAPQSDAAAVSVAFAIVADSTAVSDAPSN
ncbi:hypothetical protein AAC387_Pa06g0547 [Persea americana]